jgi:hypothetical protein
LISLGEVEEEEDEEDQQREDLEDHRPIAFANLVESLHVFVCLE